MNWREHLRDEGYVQFPHLTPTSLVQAARRSIENDLKTNYDSSRQAIYDNQSYCPDLQSAPEIVDLFLRSPVYRIIDELLGTENVNVSPAQIAIRKAHNCPEPIPPEPHIDGFASGLNGVPADRIYNHTVLVGVFLTPVVTEFAGNFTVWPKSHCEYERYFRVRGPAAMREPQPVLELGSPKQLLADPADVVLAHYALGHAAAVNTSSADRIAVYFRIGLKDAESQNWQYLTDIWKGWRNLEAPAGSVNNVPHPGFGHPLPVGEGTRD